MKNLKIKIGDSSEVLAGMEPESVWAVVCDPPYDLTQNGKDGGNSGGFMGKQWDATGIAFSIDFWQKVYRVVKPGGILKAFGGTRTFHRMAKAIGEAGFIDISMESWLYSSGFPKSLDISKSIDKAGGVSPSDQSRMLRDKRLASGMSREQVAQIVGCTPSSIRDWEEGRARAAGGVLEFIIPSDEYRMKLAELLGYSSDERRLIGLATDRRGDGSVYGVGHSGELRIGGNTEAARRWVGWGTALKPSWEPIVVARKPL